MPLLQKVTITSDCEWCPPGEASMETAEVWLNGGTSVCSKCLDKLFIELKEREVQRHG